MRKQRRGRPPKTTEWNERRLEEVTCELVREGLYRSDSKPLPSAVVLRGMCSPFGRAFADPGDHQAEWDKIFRDEIQEKAAWLPAKHPGFLREGIPAGFMRRRPSNLRESIARELVESGSLDDFPSKFRMTAFLISRGVKEKGEDGESIFPGGILRISNRRWTG